MKRLMIVLAVIVLLIITGGLTAQMSSQGGTLSIPGTVRVSSNPDASALDMAPWKAEQLFLFVGFILFNLIGMGLTITVVVWLINWQVRKVKAAGKTSTTAVTSTTPAAEES